MNAFTAAKRHVWQLLAFVVAGREQLIQLFDILIARRS
jgi:hypothetical protein